MSGILSRTSFQVGKLLAGRPLLALLPSRTKQNHPIGIDRASLEHATGQERLEIEAMLRGNFDPWYQEAEEIRPESRDKAHSMKIPSFYDKRIVGCHCSYELCHLKFMWVHMGDPKRCECGYWMELVKAEDPFKDIHLDPPAVY